MTQETGLPRSTRFRFGPAAALLLAALAGCSKPAPAPEPVATSVPAPTPPIALPPTAARNSDDPALFAPLQSGKVKDAIYQALKTGQTQRWQDGALSGYAVPSQTTGANGCRAVRYTVDQRQGATYESITACDATPR
ncbi:MAG: hypothetical protein JWM75_758 [Sphingomonas bacterium]|nr:hypothetical protein [Sphingomonas bacterium]